tara:strand:- start:98 stop:322 length:225 start_codon:yes stop_codon:yes gene_type:complete
MNNIDRDVFIYASLLAEHGDHLIRTPTLEAFLRRFYLKRYKTLGKEGKYIFDKAIKQILEYYFASESYDKKRKN